MDGHGSIFFFVHGLFVSTGFQHLFAASKWVALKRHLETLPLPTLFLEIALM